MDAGARRQAPRPAAAGLEANETLKRLADRVGKGHLAFICECNDPGCMEPVPLSSEEYDEIREAGYFLVASGHDDTFRERVISATARFTVVARTSE